jgi:hypothetical protein
LPNSQTPLEYSTSTSNNASKHTPFPTLRTKHSSLKENSLRTPPQWSNTILDKAFFVSSHCLTMHFSNPPIVPSILIYSPHLNPFYSFPSHPTLPSKFISPSHQYSQTVPSHINSQTTQIPTKYIPNHALHKMHNFPPYLHPHPNLHHARPPLLRPLNLSTEHIKPLHRQRALSVVYRREGNPAWESPRAGRGIEGGEENDV